MSAVPPSPVACEGPGSAPQGSGIGGWAWGYASRTPPTRAGVRRQGVALTYVLRRHAQILCAFPKLRDIRTPSGDYEAVYGGWEGGPWLCVSESSFRNGLNGVSGAIRGVHGVLTRMAHTRGVHPIRARRTIALRRRSAAVRFVFWPNYGVPTGEGQNCSYAPVCACTARVYEAPPDRQPPVLDRRTCLMGLHVWLADEEPEADPGRRYLPEPDVDR